MPTMFDDVDAVCPFYLRSDKRKIVCDCAGNYSIELAFDKSIERDLHKRKYCDTFDFSACKICAMNEKSMGGDCWWRE